MSSFYSDAGRRADSDGWKATKIVLPARGIRLSLVLLQGGPWEKCLSPVGIVTGKRKRKGGGGVEILVKLSFFFRL